MKKGILGLLLFAFLVMLAIGAWRYWRSSGDRPERTFNEQRLNQLRLALAETENLNPSAAIPLWTDLYRESPEDLDSLQNLIISQLSELTQQKQLVENSTASVAEREAAENGLPEKIVAARKNAQQFLSEAEQVGEQWRVKDAVWLSGQVELFAADLGEDEASPNADAALNRLAFEAAEQLLKEPATLPFVGWLEETAAQAQDPLSGPSPELAAKVAKAFTAASAASPRNLVVAFRALEYALTAKDVSAKEVIERLQDQLPPLNPIVRQRAGNVDLQSLLEEARAGIDQGDFSGSMSRVRILENLFRGTSAYRSDLQLTRPHPLDLVATGTFNAMSLEFSRRSEVAPSVAPITFAAPRLIAKLPAPATSISIYDVDLDEVPEIVATTATSLHIFRREGLQDWTEMCSLPGLESINGCTITDLFLADGDAPRKLKRTFPSDATTDTDLAVRNSKRHTVFPSFLLSGRDGIRIVRFDGRPEVADNARLLPVEDETGLESVREILAVQPLDLDADGDLDLAVSSQSQGVRLFVNRDNMTFFEVTEFSQVPNREDPVVGLALVDWNRDLAIDLLTIQASGQTGWLENLLHFQMRWNPLVAASEREAAEVAAPKVDGGSFIAGVEWDGNVSWDAVYRGRMSLGILRTETTAPGQIRPLAGESVSLPDLKLASTPGNTFATDIDNDSWIDVLILGPTGGTLVRGGPLGTQTRATSQLFDQSAEASAVGELTDDLGLDICLATGAEIFLLENTTEGLGNFVSLQMTGIYDNATGRVNHYAIGSTHELRFGPHYRAAVATDRTTRFGIGKRESADNLRTILTNGVTQNVLNPEIDVTLVEEQSLKGSCPYLYAWDGEKFAFVTDCLWAAPLGLQYALGKVVPDRPWEYLKIDGSALHSKDGYYEIRLTEELWEIAYFDHVSLIAVDHPSGTEIWSNEKVGPPDVTQHKIWVFNNAVPIAHALDTRGEDCTDLLRAQDERYVQAFDARYLQGICPPHWIDLNLGTVQPGDRVHLLLTGWILPTDTSLNIRIDQDSSIPSVEAPSLWIPDGNGGWQESIPAIGFPGGKTKTIVVDVTGKFNAADPRVRIRTSAQIYWDAASVAINPPQEDAMSTPLELLSAEVAYHGFSEKLPRDPSQPERYDYNRVRAAAKWPPLSGGLTRFGDVRDLLSTWDDSMVVISGGDEIRLRFKVPETPVPEGWQRDFILHSVGWDKDADLNTLEGQAVDPLPFKTMTGYPPAQADLQRAAEVWELNGWHRTRTQPFRAFWKR